LPLPAMVFIVPKKKGMVMPPKYDQFSKPAQKLLGLFGALLFTGREYSLTGLANMLNCSKQTVLRMMENIKRSKEVGIETRLAGDGQRWYRVKAPSTRPRVSFSPEQIRHLVLCRDMVMHLLPKGLRDEIENTIARSTVLLPDMQERSEALLSMARSMVKGSIDYTPHQENIERLLRCIREKVVCTVLYQASPASPGKSHSFAPLRMVSYREALYVSGFKVADQGKPEIINPMTLCIHRIRNAVRTIRTHDHQINDHGDGFFGFEREKPFRVKVEFNSEVANYVLERTWSEDQKCTKRRNGSVVLEFTAQSRPEVVSWVLGFGGHAQLLAPKDVKQDIADEVRKMVATYLGHGQENEKCFPEK
jgi:predicted DNA-binding transcriptional regulator YafY